MNEEIKSALFRVLPFAIILFILIIQINRNKIKAKDLYINKPFSIKHFCFGQLDF